MKVKNKKKTQLHTRDGQLISANSIDGNVKRLLDRHISQDLTYKHITTQFETLAEQFNWRNGDGSLYPVSLETLKKYVAIQQTRIGPQSIISYLSMLKEKQMSLGQHD